MSSKKKIKIFVVGTDNKCGDWIPGCEIVYTLHNADLIVYRGGTDVNPALYGQKPHPKTDKSDHSRDMKEINVFEDALKEGIPMLGICRGAQFLTVMNGGELIQNVNSHHGVHQIKTVEGKEVGITSSHHQMMYPFNMDNEKYKILAWTKKGKSTCYQATDYDDKVELTEDFVEPEVVWYPKTRSLAIQGHPEWGNMPKDGKELMINWVMEYCLKNEPSKVLTA